MAENDSSGNIAKFPLKHRGIQSRRKAPHPKRGEGKLEEIHFPSTQDIASQLKTDLESGFINVPIYDVKIGDFYRNSIAKEVYYPGEKLDYIVQNEKDLLRAYVTTFIHGVVPLRGELETCKAHLIKSFRAIGVGANECKLQMEEIKARAYAYVQDKYPEHAPARLPQTF